MFFQESETVELKAIFVEDIKKEIIAMANGQGGTLYVGVNDDGTVVGVDFPDETIQRISNMVRDSIKPDITMFLHYELLTQDDRSIVAVDIQRGTNRPYYLAKKGLRPEGVYIRQGTSSVPASDTSIRQMIKETDGDHFEEMRSLEQDLTFQATEHEFAIRNIPFGPQQMKTLKLINTVGVYTNLALLLSDQCSHTIKVAVFSDNTQAQFQDRREFTGSLFHQLSDAYQYIDLHNCTRSTFRQLLRIDTRDYPEVALREALLNAIVHRDYSFRSSILISIYTNRIEVVSIGGLLPGIAPDDIMIGLSVCRNSALANVFYRLELIEAYGTGMQRIINAYADTDCKPSIEVTSNAFKIILPNINAQQTPMPATVKYSPPISGSYLKEDIVTSYARKHYYITRKDVEKMLDLSPATAGRLLKQMHEDGILLQEGNGKNTRYRLA